MGVINMSSKVAEIFETMEYGTAMESDSTAKEWLAQHADGFGHYINGRFTAGENTNWMETSNPANGETLAKVAVADTEMVDEAVQSARKAQLKWEALSGFERAKYLYALARLIQKNARLLAVVETLDNGKTIRETRDIDVQLAARHFYHHAGWAQLLEEKCPDHQAYGVVGQIIPWNFPFLMLAWKIAPALATGNTVVLKPAEFTPLTACLFAELCQEAGIPKGVVNIVHGDGETGAKIVNHDDVNKIAFTGSTDVGRIIREATAGTGKGLTLELGGKSPMIVFENADLDAAVEGVVDGIWFNQGEVCCAASRLLVQEGIHDAFVAKLKARIEALRIGNPLDKTMDMGSVVDQTQYDRIDALVKQGVEEGATCIQPTSPCPTNGCFYPPTILTDVEPASTVAETEIFGPVISVISFRTQHDAVQISNNSRYGLAASIWSENINLALDLAPKLKAGVVWVNATNLFDAACGFGGYKESGFGREGGQEGLYAYLKPKYFSKLKSYPETKDDGLNSAAERHTDGATVQGIDRTPKLYIGGKQARPDGAYVSNIINRNGQLVGQVGEGNRKDIRNAVEAAAKAEGWSKSAHHLRAQILYYIAENLDIRRDEFASRITAMTGESNKKALDEVDQSVERLFYYAGYCDKYDGDVHTPPMRSVAIAMKESIGNVGIICPDEKPLLGFISLMAPAIAMGNRVIMVPSETAPLSATDLYQVFETSDLPAGVVNIVTGKSHELAQTLAAHNNVDAMWSFASDRETAAMVEKESIGNLKQTWTNRGLQIDWSDRNQACGETFLRHATQVKNIWVPYGE